MLFCEHNFEQNLLQLKIAFFERMMPWVMVAAFEVIHQLGQRKKNKEDYFDTLWTHSIHCQRNQSSHLM